RDDHREAQQPSSAVFHFIRSTTSRTVFERDKKRNLEHPIGPEYLHVHGASHQSSSKCFRIEYFYLKRIGRDLGRREQHQRQRDTAEREYAVGLVSILYRYRIEYQQYSDYLVGDVRYCFFKRGPDGALRIGSDLLNCDGDQCCRYYKKSVSHSECHRPEFVEPDDQYSWSAERNRGRHLCFGNHG